MITKYLQKKLLNHVFAASSYTIPTTLYVALFTALPVDADGDLVAANEVSGFSYARVAITNDGTVFTVLDATDHDVASLMSNASAITFPSPTGSWGTVTHMGIFDQAGNLLAYAALSAQVVVGAGRVVSFPIASLTINAANCS